jgi:uracil-DNA glycosylase family 4
VYRLGVAGQGVQNELARIAAMARELVEWDQGLGGRGLPEPEMLPAFEAPRAEKQAGAVDAPERAVDPPPPIVVPTEGDGPTRLVALSGQAASCTRCRLHEGRTKSVFARGAQAAEIAFVGEGPGYHEDQHGAPFVGDAGQLLDKMVGAMGFARDEVYVCNVVKCRPPENRTPTPDEANACKPFLAAQLAIVKPKIIVALGRCAAEHLGCLEAGARGWRGRWSVYEGIAVMPTYHPAFLLRTPKMKRPVWEDLQKVMGRLGKAQGD